MPRQQPGTSTRRPGTRLEFIDGKWVKREPASAASAKPAKPARRAATPRAPREPQCGYVFDDIACDQRGEHLCAPRATKVCGFFADVLVHTKGRWARQKFDLAAWQADDIVIPLFGTVVYDEQSQRYVRRYRVAWIELARKNGKSELLAGIALYLLLADDEEGAEIYGCARDREQARKVYDVAERMVALSPLLSRRLKRYAQAKRIIDEKTGSWYEIVPSDAAGNLGHNPHGVILDEVISQRDGSLWNAMRTAMGARTQPLMVAATTAGDDIRGFAGSEHAEMQRIAEDPSRAPHVFVYMRNLPMDADPFDESNWTHANPALGTFLSIQALRDEALEARNDPAKEHAFRQFRLNQWVSVATRWMPMTMWDASSGPLWLKPDWGRAALAGRVAYGGLDLAAKFDLTAWCLLVPGDDPADPVDALWRFWLPEAGLERLDKLNDNKFSRWAREGWLTVTEGSVIDYERVVADIAEDARLLRIAAVDSDEWSMWPIIARVADACGLDADQGEVTAYRNSYDRMSPGMLDLMGLVRSARLHHHGNPIARFCADVCDVRRAPYDANLVRPSKPDRSVDRARIDAIPTAAMAANAWRNHDAQTVVVSAYEDDALMVV